MAAGFNHFRVWVGLLFLLAGFPASGSQNSAWFTRVWQIDDGLLDNDINGITQGPDDYLWLVTPVGLMQFDGVNFSPFPIEDYYGRPSLHIRSALCSRKGVMWLAFDGGTIIGVNPDFSITSLDDSLPTRSPYALAGDQNGDLWMAYSDAVYRAQNGKATKFTTRDGVPQGNFHALTGDGFGNIWLAKGNQISCFETGRFQPITLVEGVQCMTATRGKAIWLVANSHLFSCDSGGALRDFGSLQVPPYVRATSLLEDSRKSVWIGTDGEGLFHYDQSHFERVDTSHSSILSLAQDREGNIWVGTGGGGLDRITPGGIRVEALENNQVQSQIQSICQDARGVLWGATQNGSLVSQNAGQWTPEFTNSSFAGTVSCVAADSTSLWVGTRNGALQRIIGANSTIISTNATRGAVRGLLPAANGDLWIVGNDILQRLHKGQMLPIALPRPVHGVSAITEDASGNIWVGASGVLLRFDGRNSLVNETARIPLSNRPICCLYGTDDGSLWIGSRGGGLMRIKNGDGGQIGLKQGLENSYISQIVADDRGWLWFASSHGIFKLRQREIDQAMKDHHIVLRPVVYGKNEGLISQEALFSIASPFILPHAVRSADGRIWMLTHSGVVVADPDILSDNTNPPPILLAQVAMDGQVIASHNGFAPAESAAVPQTLNRQLQIPPSHRHLEFDFTAFNYRAPENLQFRYQLKGYDNGWSPAGPERTAAYSRLGAGDYQFRVEASVGDGPWSPPATVDFEVIPFFWQTWWFRVSVVLAFTLSLIAIVRYVSYRRLRMRLHAMEQQAAVERERGRIARDIHDDLGNRLTEIQLLTGLAERNDEVPQNTMTHIHEISSAARQATDALDEIVWAINPGNDTLPHLINYLGQFATDFMRTAGIQCRLDLPENPPAKSVSAEVRHNLFLAIKESLNNIARHSNATEVSVLILATEKSLNVIIQDNGRGFAGDAKTDGADGLENMRLRIAEIGGQFQIKSTPGVGTSISFNGEWLEE
jgi:signal transduction histidine kinase/ligand-binding sensor domain-containing protein